MAINTLNSAIYDNNFNIPQLNNGLRYLKIKVFS